MEYSDRMDAQIAELLSSRNRVSPAHLPGVPDEEGAALLRHYAELHGAEDHVVWDGRRLIRERPAQADAPECPPEAGDPGGSPPQSPTTSSGSVIDESSRKPSPVDEILAAPVDKSLLDSAAAGGAVPVWLWVLPLVFLLPGGLLAWWLARDTNRATARAMLITGVVMTVLSVASASLLNGLGQQLNQVIEQSR